MKKDNIKIYIRELYCDKKNLDKLIDWFFKNTKDIEHKYFCRYITKDKIFIRVGFLNIGKRRLKQFDDECYELKLLIQRKIWEEHPKSKEFDMELMKFVAYDTYDLIQEHFKKFKKYYEWSPMRKRDFWGLRTSKDERANIDTRDLLHFIHHIMNMLDIGYNKEMYIFEWLKSNSHYGLHNNKEEE